MARKVLKEVMFEEENEIEICISCGKETKYKKGDNVTYRQDYIEGAGQLCFECGQATPTGITRDRGRTH